jgi:hypothetical protein
MAGASRDSRASRLRVLERRDSVAKMLYDGVSGLLAKFVHVLFCAILLCLSLSEEH